MQLEMLNAGIREVEVLDVFPATADPLLGIQTRKGVVLHPGIERVVATVTYVGAAQGRFSGKLRVLTTDSSAAVEVPYQARVVHGSFRYNAENATFEAREGRAVHSQLLITNSFPQPVKVFSAKPTDASFTVDSFRHGHVLPPGGMGPPFQVTFNSNSSDLAFTAYLMIKTNVTLLSIPLKVAHGRLHYSLQPPLGHRLAEPEDALGTGSSDASQHRIDFGMIGVNEARALSFNVSNPNPVDIEISKIESTLAEVGLRLDAVYSETGAPLRPDHGGTWDLFSPGGGVPNATAGQPDGHTAPADSVAKAPKHDTSTPAGSAGGLRLADQGEESGEGSLPVPSATGQRSTVALMLGPGMTAAFTAVLTASEQREASGEIVVVTPKERNSIPVLYHSLVGSLSIAPTMVRFEGCYPGMVSPRRTLLTPGTGV